MPGIRNIKAAEHYVHAVTDPAEHQWLEMILFQLMLHESRHNGEAAYDCDALYVVQALQDLWHRHGVLADIVQGIMRPNDWAIDDP